MGPLTVPDLVNSPPHYREGDIECIDAIRAALGKDGFVAYCQGNCVKYLWRWKSKGGMQDLHKARWYLDRLIMNAAESRLDVGSAP
jgi:hypothetical protein